MRIIFLDIDGVLNYHDFLVQEQERRTTRVGKLLTIKDEATWEDMLAPECVRRLEGLVQRTGARIVISSSWRHAHPQSKIHRFLQKKGFTGNIIGVTPRDIREKFSQAVERGDEIEAWLDTYAYGGDQLQPVESFVILDDNHVGGTVQDRLILTSCYTGLLDEHVEAAIKLFDTPFKRKKKALFIPKKRS